MEQTLGAACDAALAELYTEALGLQGSARDEVRARHHLIMLAAQLSFSLPLTTCTYAVFILLQ